MYMWTSGLMRLTLVYCTGDVGYQWCELKSYRGRTKNMSAPRYNSNTGWLNCHTHVHIVNVVDGAKSYQEDGLTFFY